MSLSLYDGTDSLRHDRGLDNTLSADNGTSNDDGICAVWGDVDTSMPSSHAVWVETCCSIVFWTTTESLNAVHTTDLLNVALDSVAL